MNATDSGLAEAGYPRLADRLDSWIRARLWAQVLVGLILGTIIGLLLGPEAELVSRETARVAGEWLALPGQIFLALIKMVLILLVASSIVIGLATGAENPAQLRANGARFALFVIATTAAAGLLGAWLAVSLKPGSLIPQDVAPVVELDRAQSDSTSAEVTPLRSVVEKAPDAIAALVPSNPFAAAVNSEMLAVVVFALFIGAAYVASSNKPRLEPIIRLFEALLDVSMTVVKWAMYLTPLAVLGLTAQLLAQLGLSSLVALGAYVATVLLGLLLLVLGYLLLVVVLGRIGPLSFLRAAGPAQLLAFSTSSSAAVMPLTIRTAVEGLGVPASLASFLIPLAATVNMAGTALYQSVAVIFVAQVAGVTLGAGEIAVIVVTLVTASIGAPGAPGVSIAILSGLIASFGIPPYGLVFVLGVDRFLDMARTAVNVTGDLAIARILGNRSQP